ncbi:MAG: hypothetical protein JOZ78_20380 [Chroococcidiopsidaceae cyanobacterium CP_BM_ER_R8_30]|nr:hypothetical protein [Chroococcidiopsidaceae cyanobacterium CP_BM_ER_R8_30]
MRLHKMNETNLFDALSDREQELIAGGFNFTTTQSWGSVAFSSGPNGSYSFIAPNGAKYTASWNQAGGLNFTTNQPGGLVAFSGGPTGSYSFVSSSGVKYTASWNQAGGFSYTV